MVSSKVHTQLLEIADEKAMAAERRASELDKEVCNGTKNLKNTLVSHYFDGPRTNNHACRVLAPPPK